MARQDERESRIDKASIPRPYSNWNLPAHYEIRSLLGVGSYGHVCEVHDFKVKHNVAVKKIPRAFDELIDCKRILREVALLGRLQHVNVVSLHDFLIPGDPGKFEELYLVLELADSDLKKLLKSPVHLTELHVQTLLYNLLVGLKFVHSCGIYHRDLKPANCLVNNDCCVKICDFGLARTVEAPRDPTTLPGALGDADDIYTEVLHNRKMKRQLTSHVVTRWYRAPELILLQEDYTEAIDVWSVGCIFAELLGMMRMFVHIWIGALSSLGALAFLYLPIKNKQSTSRVGSFHLHLKIRLRFRCKGNRDQLSVIFDVIGSPTDEDIAALGKDDAKKYVRLFNLRPGINLRDKFPGASTEAVTLLKRMLTFNPKNRITVNEALESRYFKEIRTKDQEKVASSFMKLPFDDWKNMSESELRFAFLKEAQKFNPSQFIPAHLAGVGYRKSQA